MNQEITASYVWTADELIRAREHHGRAQCRPAYRAGLVFLSFMAILAGWCNYQTHGWSVLTVLAPVGGTYFLLLRKQEVRWVLRRHFKKRPDRNLHVTWTLGEDALQIKTGESESKQNWSQIAEVRKARNGFLLYPNDSIFHWLPMTALASEEDRNQVEKLLQGKVKDFANIR
jgi:hypothetical protein